MNKLLSILLVFLSMPCYAQKIPGLISSYTFNNGTTENEVTHKYALPVGASLSEDRFGNTNSAYYLYGSIGSYINLGTGSELKPVIGTISIWVKLDNPIYAGKGYYVNPIILTKSQPGNDFFEGYCIALDLGNRSISVCNTLSELTQVNLRSLNPLKKGVWCHILATYDDDSLTLYVDGKFEHRLAKNFRSRFLATDSVMVGHSANTKNKRFFNGWIDDIEIYNRVLTSEEVLLLYNRPDFNRYHIIRNYIAMALAGIAAILVLIRIITLRYRKELRKEKEKNRLQRQMFDMEMQIIKAQMNPHFIFNAMNSVQQFILAGDNENAHKYLGKFSRLLRRILESNNEDFISLDSEIEMLAKYIEIESLRFDQSFKYEIITDAEVTTSRIRIPQMLIQPIVENAIWHGLLPKKENGNLSITFEYIHNKLLSCTVDDNGVGRQTSEQEKTVLKRKSLAIRFIHQRLELMKKEWGGDYSMNIIDKINPAGTSNGTSVIIKIPIIN
jgi:hypothetical protein